MIANFLKHFLFLSKNTPSNILAIMQHWIPCKQYVPKTINIQSITDHLVQSHFPQLSYEQKKLSLDIVFLTPENK